MLNMAGKSGKAANLGLRLDGKIPLLTPLASTIVN